MKFTPKPYTSAEQAIRDNASADLMRKKMGTEKYDRSESPDKLEKSSVPKSASSQAGELTLPDLSPEQRKRMAADFLAELRKDEPASKKKEKAPKKLTEEDIKMIRNTYH